MSVEIFMIMALVFGGLGSFLLSLERRECGKSIFGYAHLITISLFLSGTVLGFIYAPYAASVVFCVFGGVIILIGLLFLLFKLNEL